MSSSAAYKGYIGIWEEKEGIIEGAEVAANKSGNMIYMQSIRVHSGKPI